MLRLSLQSGLLRALTRRADSRAFPLVVAGAALAAELSMSVPFASLLMAAVLLAPRRWVSIATLASLGAAVGALVLYLVFHHLGWNRLFAAYPDVVRSTAWRDATHWLEHYGVVSLSVIAALPVPLTPLSCLRRSRDFRSQRSSPHCGSASWRNTMFTPGSPRDFRIGLCATAGAMSIRCGQCSATARRLTVAQPPRGEGVGSSIHHRGACLTW